MNTSTLHGLKRGITVRRTAALGGLLAAVGAPLIALSTSPTAAAGPEDELFWYPDENAFTQTSDTTSALDIGTFTGYGPLDGFTSPFDNSMLALPDELQANITETSIPWLDGYEGGTWDITSGDAEIPTGSVIDLSGFPSLSLATETVDIPGAGLFGLPEITETLFTSFGDFSI
jgi:hypothetical protein